MKLQKIKNESVSVCKDKMKMIRGGQTEETWDTVYTSETTGWKFRDKKADGQINFDLVVL
ncbi:MAG: hypothetical protein LBK94_03195 [Prevotellaceae bacterium]|jgi:hypothetical protein|nr:hypothetical protein [Prevotellaceae bacterium]